MYMYIEVSLPDCMRVWQYQSVTTLQAQTLFLYTLPSGSQLLVFQLLLSIALLCRVSLLQSHSWKCHEQSKINHSIIYSLFQTLVVGSPPCIFPSLIVSHAHHLLSAFPLLPSMSPHIPQTGGIKIVKHAICIKSSTSFVNHSTDIDKQMVFIQYT